MKLVDENKCTGCEACYNICPMNAIEMKADKKGFLRPNIIKEKCISCYMCKNVCPAINYVLSKNIPLCTYAVWNTDEIRLKSSSGGMFTHLAKYIIENNGIIYGTAFDKNYIANIIRISNLKELYKINGSKYVQSQVGLSYRKIKEDLNEKKIVLFSGTPCQVDGLFNFLGKNYDNLYTVDIVCHGVPSPLIFKKYLEYIRKSNVGHGEIININFRYKKPSWTVFSIKIDFEDGYSYINNMYNDFYLRSFLENYISRECCSQCNYSCIHRKGDITIGDFWKYYSNKRRYRNDEKGISLVLINNEKGKKLFNSLKINRYINKDINEALNGNRCLYKPYGFNQNSYAYWNLFFKNYSFQDIEKHLLGKPKQLSYKFKINCFYRNNAYILPKKIINIINRIIKKIKGT